MKNTFLALFIFGFSHTAWSMPAKTLFLRLQAQQMGHIKTQASFHVGDTYTEGGVGTDWRESVVTTVLEVNDNIVHYKAISFTGANDSSRSEIWVNTQTGQLVKRIIDGKEVPVGTFEPIEHFDKIETVKVQTFLGEKDCVALSISARLSADRYTFCDELPGLGYFGINSQFIVNSGGFQLIDFTSFALKTRSPSPAH